MTQLKRDVFASESHIHSSLNGPAEERTASEGVLKQVGVPVADLFLARNKARLDRQILFGHPVRQLVDGGPVARDETSGYVGRVAVEDLAPWTAPTHRVRARTTLLFREPNIKSPNPRAISCGSLLSLAESDGKFAQTNTGLHALVDHCEPITTQHIDLASTAETLLGTPYLWGGNAAFGIDCSGLVQLAAQRAGVACPGDSDQQLATLGTEVSQGASPRRNDLLFWPGHVALVFDQSTLIHANAYHMAVAFERLSDAMQRIEKQGDGPLLAHKRL